MLRFICRLSPLVVGGVLLGACDRPAEYGVSVFSTDTIPVTFTVELTGSLALGLRSEQFHVTPDKKLVLSTPAQMVVQRKDGTARIVADSGRRIAVQPLGIAPTEGDTTTVEGTTVLLTSPPDPKARTISLKVVTDSTKTAAKPKPPETKKARQ